MWLPPTIPRMRIKVSTDRMAKGSAKHRRLCQGELAVRACQREREREREKRETAPKGFRESES